jgi:hypothetical protein
VNTSFFSLECVSDIVAELIFSKNVLEGAEFPAVLYILMGDRWQRIAVMDSCKQNASWLPLEYQPMAPPLLPKKVPF